MKYTTLLFPGLPDNLKGPASNTAGMVRYVISSVTRWHAG